MAGGASANHKGVVVGGRFRLHSMIGSGSFGDIWLAHDVETGSRYAVKMESRRARHPQLQIEAKVLKILKSDSFHGCPRMYFFGVEGKYNVLVMELLGRNLQDLLEKSGNRFSVGTTIRVAIQALRLIRFVHSRGLMHRDIKPENLLMGRHSRGRQHVLHIIDFGLAKQYMHPRTKLHIPPRTGKALTGTPRYASLNNHAGHEQSRRDDLESLGYLFVYFLKGKLPWQGLRAKTREEKYEAIRTTKERVMLSELCAGCPKVFEDFLHYARTLKFDQEPDYDALHRRFVDCAVQEGIDLEVDDYDWDRVAAQDALQRQPAGYAGGAGRAAATGRSAAAMGSNVPTGRSMATGGMASGEAAGRGGRDTYNR